MSETKIVNAAHAVKVLEALVEQVKNIDAKGGSKNVKLSVEGDANGMKYFWVRYQMGMASTEGAKAVLKLWDGLQRNKKENPHRAEEFEDPELDLGIFITDLAKAYAPRMAEAGMEVPNA
ncbi:hypothetical protein LCGC14_1377140 [marine sediment metagenome]|uniref:Uncharacterized protein n=1 Tax=marine sediment metagenome TaxID=412755 RepID=A0A0F9K432_9ZZZZ